MKPNNDVSSRVSRPIARRVSTIILCYPSILISPTSSRTSIIAKQSQPRGKQSKTWRRGKGFDWRLNTERRDSQQSKSVFVSIFVRNTTRLVHGACLKSSATFCHVYCALTTTIVCAGGSRPSDQTQFMCLHEVRMRRHDADTESIRAAVGRGH